MTEKMLEVAYNTIKQSINLKPSVNVLNDNSYNEKMSTVLHDNMNNTITKVIPVDYLSLSQRKILGSSKLRVFADNNFNFDKKRRKFSKWVENTVGKGEIAHHEQFLPFQQCFQKTCTANM